MSDELAISASLSSLASLSGQHPASVLDGVRHDLQVDAVGYSYRAAARDEEVRIYQLAGYTNLEKGAVPRLPARTRAPVQACIDGLHALYQLAGYDAYYLVNARFDKPYGGVLTPAQLKELYVQAQQNYGVDWTYLAAINFVESDFGRVLGPSSAGAEGPMQFEPATWDSYGRGGDINNPHDAIDAAARYLVHYGAPGDMRTAIFHYNLDYNYVDSIVDFSQAMREDPTWLDRMYYWGTTG